MRATPVFEAHLPQSRPLTWDDLQTIPDDQHWAYQLVDGQLIVAPSTTARHQSCVLALAMHLHASCPAELCVIVAPFDYAPRPGYVLQPDIIVARREDVLPQRIEAAPLLAVEVFSPSSRTIDRSLKRAVYEEYGVASYWMVDPEEPSVTVLTLVDGGYVETHRVTGPDEFVADAPFEVRVRPLDLVDG